jgi:hypothetical protein
MKTLPALLRAAALSLVALPAAHAAATKPFSVALKPGEMHEECTRIEAGEKRDYYWKANAPVDFNIHYHDASKVSYPVKREAMRGDGGTFAASLSQDYCWMWTARDKPAKLEGKIDSK